MITAVFMGTPATAASVLERLTNLAGVRVAAAVTAPDRPRGRGRRPEPPPVKLVAKSAGIPVMQPANLRGESVLESLAALTPDVIVVAAYGRLLPRAVLDLPARGCLNLHPSLLPRHRGPTPVQSAILGGDQSTGVSLMLLDEGMDTGPILARAEVPLLGDERAGDLTADLFCLGAALLEENLECWVKGDVEAMPQNQALATVTAKLERTDGLVDWSDSATALARKSRAFDPWPGLYTQWSGKTLKFLECLPVPRDTDNQATPGRVLQPGPAGELRIATGADVLSVSDLQLEGRRPMAAPEFLNGYPHIVGAQLGGEGGCPVVP